MVSKAVCQGAAQLQFGTEVKVLVVHQAFSPVSNDQDFMDDLLASVKPAANVVLAKVNMDEILHAHLGPCSMGHISSTSHD
jgi:hypothetical protein